MRVLVIASGVLVAGAVLFGLALPEVTHVERRVTMAASPAQVFAHLDDFRRWAAWSPWHPGDPQGGVVYDGAPRGAGAVMRWTSDVARVGSGRQTIVESVENRVVRTRLELARSGTAETAFVLTALEGATEVAWSFETSHGLNLIGRVYGAFFADGWIGPDLDQGLARLKILAEADAAEAARVAAAIAEARARPPAPLTPLSAVMAPEVVVLPARPVLRVRAEAPASDPAAISAAIGAAYQAIGQALADLQMPMTGPPLTISQSFDPQGLWVFDAAIPVAALPPAGAVLPAGVTAGQTPATRAVKILHKGPYETLGAAYEAGAAFALEQGLAEAPGAIEEYLSDPAATPPAEVLTNVYMFLTP